MRKTIEMKKLMEMQDLLIQIESEIHRLKSLSITIHNIIEDKELAKRNEKTAIFS